VKKIGDFRLLSLIGIILQSTACGALSATTPSELQTQQRAQKVEVVPFEAECKPHATSSARNTSAFLLQSAASIDEFAIANSERSFRWKIEGKLDETVTFEGLKNSGKGYLQSEKRLSEGLLLRLRVYLNNIIESHSGSYLPTTVHVSLISAGDASKSIAKGFASSFGCGESETLESGSESVSESNPQSTNIIEHKSVAGSYSDTHSEEAKETEQTKQTKDCRAEIIDPCWKILNFDKNEILFQPSNDVCLAARPKIFEDRGGNVFALILNPKPDFLQQ
jgi:hypothetical protein